MLSRLAENWSRPHPSGLSAAIAERRAAGRGIIDLVTTNPHDEGILFSTGILRSAAAQAAADTVIYAPDPKGQIRAREAVARYHGTSPDNVILTPGTSFAYWYAFRLLADPGDDILCPSPTYPLFDDIAAAASVNVRRYHLQPPAAAGSHWSIDPQELEFQITPRTRAIVLVSPHNPTGSVATEGELEKVAEIAARRDLPIIFDEVFREFTHSEIPVSRPAQFEAPLCITLNGFSKMFSLPGLKAGWMVVEGEQEFRSGFLNSLEYLSDTFLPVGEWTQAALPIILEDGSAEISRLRSLYIARMNDVTAALRSDGLAVTMPEAGPYILLPTSPSIQDEELCIKLVRDEGILLHPGSYYALPPGYLVATCVKSLPWPRLACVPAG